MIRFVAGAGGSQLVTEHSKIIPGRAKPRPRNATRQGFIPAEAARDAEIARTPGLPARIAAANVICDVVQGGHRLDECFSPLAVPSRIAGLDARDAALARSIATAAVRRLGVIRHALAALMDKGLPKQASRLEWTLIAAAAQILFLDAADHAAVDLAVRTVRLEPKTAGFAGFINGVLRNLARRREEFLQEGADGALDAPTWLLHRWRKNYGEAASRAIAAIRIEEAPLDVTVKSDAAGWAERLDALVLPTGSLRLRARTPIVELPGYAEGEWWVQDAAAALPARLLAVQADERVLDMCAAPGGKTAQLALARAQVTALDRAADRLKLLAANLARLDLHAEIAVGDATSYSAQPFDAILLDAPCSATGTARRHPDVPWTKKPGDIESLVGVQTRMLDRAALLTRPGGRIVYCTCSLEPEEGEWQIAAFLRRNPDFRRAPIDPAAEGIPAEFVNADGDLRTLPLHWPAEDPRLAGVDGFFAARVVRAV